MFKNEKTEEKETKQDNQNNEIKKYPKVVAGVFIFNEKEELFLMKHPRWYDKYTCPGGKIEIGETIIEAAKREVKEETNMDIEDVELFHVGDGLGLEDTYKMNDNHLIFLDHKAKVKGIDNIILSDEGTGYKWLSLDEWLNRDKKELAPFIHSQLVKLKNIKAKEDFEHKYKRALADFQNLLKRTAEEKAEFAKFANEQLILDIIPVYDHLVISFEHIDESARNNGWGEGIKYVVKQFSDVLKNMGVEEIDPTGKEFDPRTMEAIEGKGERVKKTVKRGYILKGKVIVPARVVLE
jgi:nucleoside triphosphatase